MTVVELLLFPEKMTDMNDNDQITPKEVVRLTMDILGEAFPGTTSMIGVFIPIAGAIWSVLDPKENDDD